MLLKESGTDFEQPPVGTHLARCVSVIDIGTQKSEYQGKVNLRRQIIIGWELCNEHMQSGEFAGMPMKVGKFYTASLSEKANLRHDLENWRGRAFSAQELLGFDAKNIVGVPCLLSLTENDKGKVRVTGVMAVPRGTPVPPQVHPRIVLFLERDEFDKSTFDSLSEKMQAIIKLSPEYQELQNAPVQSDDVGSFGMPEEDIPF